MSYNFQTLIELFLSGKISEATLNNLSNVYNKELELKSKKKQILENPKKKKKGKKKSKKHKSIVIPEKKSFKPLPVPPKKKPSKPLPIPPSRSNVNIEIIDVDEPSHNVIIRRPKLVEIPRTISKTVIERKPIVAVDYIEKPKQMEYDTIPRMVEKPKRVIDNQPLIKKKLALKPIKNTLSLEPKTYQFSQKPQIKRNWILTEKAFKNSIETYRWVQQPLINTADKTAFTVFETVNTFLDYLKPYLISLLKYKLNSYKGIKCYLIANIKYYREEMNTGRYQFITGYHKSNTLTIMNEDMREIVDKMCEKILQAHQAFLGNGSDWIFDEIESVYLNVAQYTPLSGSSYTPLPEWLQNTGSGGNRFIVNPQNKDQRCAAYCVLIHKFYEKLKVKHRERPRHYDNKFNELNLEGIDFPLKIDDIKKFEKQNNIKLNIFGTTQDIFLYVLYRNKEDPQNAINLLLHNNHYSYIRSFQSLIHHYTKHHGVKHICFTCLHMFSSQERLDKHKPEECDIENPQRYELPGGIMEFNLKNYKNKLRVPFVFYYDFECLPVPIQGVKREDELSYSLKYQTHIPCGFGIKLVSIDKNDHYNLIIYRGEDAAYHFLKTLFSFRDELVEKLKANEPIIMTPEDELYHKSTNVCWICETEISEDQTKVRDHCHITGKYRGPAHNECNMHLYHNKFYDKKTGKSEFSKTPRKPRIPVIAHNAHGYDSHFIIREAGKFSQNIEILPSNGEKFITFSIDEFKFIDSFKFLSAGLDELVSNLKADSIEKFRETAKEFPKEFLDMVTQKGFFPYDYITSHEVFKETRLPGIEKWYNRLNDTNCTFAQLLWATKIYIMFKMQHLGDYHDHYLKTDVLLLADVFENFRDKCLDIYKLDPLNYLTAPGLSLDALLLKTGQKLGLTQDLNIFNMSDGPNMRGGISQIPHRYAKANNRLFEDYDPEKPTSYIVNIDANALYGYSMSQFLPTGNLQFVEDFIIPEFTDERILSVEDDSPIGYWFKIDYDYPRELHDLHNDLPCGFEKISIDPEIYSLYEKQVRKNSNSKSSNVKKLIGTLNNKKNYVIHYRLLKLFIRLGIKITKIHSILKFNQSPWMKSFIDMHTELRKHAKNKFEEDFYKLCPNSVYGKMMENVKKHCNAKLVCDEKTKNKYINSPLCSEWRIIDNDLVIFKKFKKTVKLDKPTYVGFSILELSKVRMYEFFYTVIKPKYGDKVKIMMMDTDSFLLYIETEDIYRDILNMKEHFDLSNIPHDSMILPEEIKSLPRKEIVSLLNENKKVLGKFKIVTGDFPLYRVCGLNSKCYTYEYLKLLKPENNLLDHLQCSKLDKGIKKNVIDKKIEFEDYMNTLSTGENKYDTMNVIRSIDHHVYSIEIKKKSLSGANEKRYMLDDGIESLAYGHYRIEEIEKEKTKSLKEVEIKEVKMEKPVEIKLIEKEIEPLYPNRHYSYSDLKTDLKPVKEYIDKKFKNIIDCEIELKYQLRQSLDRNGWYENYYFAVKDKNNKNKTIVPIDISIHPSEYDQDTTAVMHYDLDALNQKIEIQSKVHRNSSFFIANSTKIPDILALCVYELKAFLKDEKRSPKHESFYEETVSNKITHGNVNFPIIKNYICDNYDADPFDTECYVLNIMNHQTYSNRQEMMIKYRTGKYNKKTFKLDGEKYVAIEISTDYLLNYRNDYLRAGIKPSPVIKQIEDIKVRKEIDNLLNRFTRKMHIPDIERCLL